MLISKPSKMWKTLLITINLPTQESWVLKNATKFHGFTILLILRAHQFVESSLVV